MSRDPARQRLIDGAIEVMRREGAAGMGISELIATSGVARRSLYVNFPGGKDELVAEAASVAGRYISAVIRDAPDPVAALRALMQPWRSALVESDFRSGCPVVAAALAGESAPSGPPAAAFAFGIWRRKVADGLQEAGLAEKEAESLAHLLVSAVEGAVMVAIAERSLAALDAVEAQLAELLRARLAAASG